jgi:nucleoside-diphosphate-sugar epimerase
VRDLVFVDDAVDAFLRAGASDACNGQVFNVGGLEPVTHRDLVALLICVAGTGRYRLVEWPAEKMAIDIGSFHADSTRIARVLGWRPTTPLASGFERTVAYYRAHLDHYIPAAGQPQVAVS